MQKVFLFGYYGFGNLGDELLCKYYARLLFNNFSGLKTIILTGKPICWETKLGSITVSRWNLWQLGKIIAPGDLLLGGGGSIFQDATSKRSLFYYLALLALAHRCGAEIILVGQGFGPLSLLGKKVARPFLDLTRIISCRDPKSLAEIKKMGVTKPLMHLEIDPLWDLEFSGRPRAIKNQEQKPVLGFFFRKGELNRKQKLFAGLSRRAVEVKLITLFPDDFFAAKKFAQQIGISPPLFIKGLDDLNIVFPEISFVIGEKLHGLLLAAKWGIPGIGLSNDPKIEAFCQQLEWPCFSWKEPYLEKQIIEAVEELLSDINLACKHLLRKTDELETKAREERDWFLQQIEEALLCSRKK